MTLSTSETPFPEIGQLLGGGICAAILREADGSAYALIVASKNAAGDAGGFTWEKARDYCAALRINGHDDWRLPTMDELTAIRAHLMPCDHVQWPAQTRLDDFKKGGHEAFETDWYWSGTQANAGFAWVQLFDYGYQGYLSKANRWRVRAVRKHPI